MHRIFSAIVFAIFIACNPSDEEKADNACATVDFGSQPIGRLPVGDVLWLPESGGPDCEPFEWALLEPSVGVLSLNDARYIPLTDGPATLVEETTGTSVQVTAIDTDLIPFHNLMYLPSRSLAAVADEVWVAEAFAPRIARLDAQTGTPLGAIHVGPWPTALAVDPAQGLVAVTHMGNDTLGLVDPETNRLVDAIWVGDEPSNVVIDPAVSVAYVSLETESAIAVVDLEARTVTDRLDSLPNPRAMTISSDGRTLFVAGHRTGRPARFPYAEDEGGQVDIQAIDLETGDIRWSVEEAGNIITDIALDEATSTIWVTATVTFPERGLVTLDNPPFEAHVQAFDSETGEPMQGTVLGPASDQEGYVLGPQALWLTDDAIWVAAQDSGVVIELDGETLSERRRIALPGGPRSLLGSSDALWVHAPHTMTVHRIDADGDPLPVTTGDDPRPVDLAAGQLHFIQPGESYGQNFSCNSCHYDGRGDTEVWRAGPFETWELSRPLMWLDGTAPLGWAAYVNDTRTFGFTGFASIIGVWPTTQMANELTRFLSSFAPPPKANGLTQRDGQLSVEATTGQKLFNGKAGCAGCHNGPLTSSNQTFEEGVTEGRVSTPVLVGAYRHNAWLKDGSAQTLREATLAAASWAGAPDLTEAEVDAIVRYVRELTDRDFFLLQHQPLPDTGPVGVDESIRLTFNQPVWTGDGAEDRFTLTDEAGALVPTTVEFNGRVVTMTPLDSLEPGSTYTTTIDDALESFDQRPLHVPTAVTFETAAEPTLAFAGAYVLAVDMPAFDLENDRFNPDITVVAPNPFVAEPSESGSSVVFQLQEDLDWESKATIDGDQFTIPPLPVKAGNSLAQGSALSGTGVDTDGDGVVDYASGEFIISGPGFYLEEVSWTIEPAVEIPDCMPGSEGSFAVTVDIDDDGIVIDWEGDAGALGLYVTTYGATLPMGPGTTVSNGDAFWAISTTTFPDGFEGPVDYGVLPENATDDSELNGIPEGGVDLVPGNCYQFSVITDTFQTASYTLEL